MKTNIKILLIQLRQLGDIILTTPVLRHLRERFPDAQIDFLAHPMAKLVLEKNPFLSRLLYYPRGTNPLEWAKLIKNLRSQKYEFVFDFMGNPRSAFLARLSGSPRRFAFSSARNIFYTHVKPPPRTSVYIAQEKMTLIEALGISITHNTNLLPDMFFSEAAKAFAENYWKSLETEHLLGGKKSRHRILISPTHRRADRRWPLENYSALLNLLAAKKEITAVWLWGPGEKEFCDKAHNLCQDGFSHVAPPTTFDQMAALMALSDAVIANSNGPSHVAAALAAHSLQIHGPTRLQSWCPLSENHRGIGAENGQIESVKVPEVFEELLKLSLFR